MRLSFRYISPILLLPGSALLFLVGNSAAHAQRCPSEVPTALKCSEDQSCRVNCASRNTSADIQACEAAWEKWAATSVKLSLLQEPYIENVRQIFDPRVENPDDIVADIAETAKNVGQVKQITAIAPPAPPSAQTLEEIGAQIKLAAQLKKSLETANTSPIVRSVAEEQYLEQLAQIQKSVSAAKGSEYVGELEKFTSNVDTEVAKADTTKKAATKAAASFSDKSALIKLELELAKIKHLTDAVEAAKQQLSQDCEAARIAAAFGTPPDTSKPPPGKVRITSASYGNGRVCDAKEFFKLQCEYATYEVLLCEKKGSGVLYEMERCAKADEANKLRSKTVYLRYDQSVCDVPVDWKSMCGGYNPAPTLPRSVTVGWTCGSEEKKSVTKKDKERVLLICN